MCNFSAGEGLFWEQAAKRHRCRFPRAAGAEPAGGRATKLVLGSGGLARAGSLSMGSSRSFFKTGLSLLHAGICTRRRRSMGDPALLPRARSDGLIPAFSWIAEAGGNVKGASPWKPSYPQKEKNHPYLWSFHPSPGPLVGLGLLVGICTSTLPIPACMWGVLLTSPDLLPSDGVMRSSRFIPRRVIAACNLH